MLLDSKNIQDKYIRYKFVMSSEHEYELTHIVNSILSVQGFVVKDSANTIAFNLEGYYFLLDKADFNSFENVFVYIDKEDLDDGELKDIEVVSLVATETSPEGISNYLHLLESTSEGLTASDSIKIKVDTNHKVTFDDGEI